MACGDPIELTACSGEKVAKVGIEVRHRPSVLTRLQASNLYMRSSRYISR